jgi:hypothetical protein
MAFGKVNAPKRFEFNVFFNPHPADLPLLKYHACPLPFNKMIKYLRHADDY